MGSHRRSWTAGLAVFTAGGIALLAAACGGGSGGSGGSSNAVAHIGTTTTSPHTTSGSASGAGAAAGAGASASGPPNPTKAGADVLKFVSCMHTHGVPNFPQPQINGNQVGIRITPAISGSPNFKSATAACQHFLPVKATSENITTAEQGDYVKAAQCMRAHGINGFPDPVFSNGNVRFPIPSNMSPNAPSFEAARHICQNLIPNGLPYSSTDENP
ncbi:MAG TPA: hypothetical protein VMF65_15860 [Acidimicrobiales bacterium]|nr:hypothetical protein [Acidimicrobiales bacterium]